ncbi:MAG: hypothetical protein HYS26_01985 [Candidatus Kaiserbacteria bacterium]|nr:MAG: hypothetical protein HYS26_01985 [Candidatus Kaiserbacteria bacterium]
MAVYFVTWDLNKEKTGYIAARDRLLKKIDQFPNTKDPGLDSVRFISSSQSSEQLAKFIKEAMDSNDSLMVMKMSGGDYYGYLQASTWEWINSNR